MFETIPKLQAYVRWEDAKAGASRKIIWPYGIAVAAIVLALGIKLALASALRGEASYLFSCPQS